LVFGATVHFAEPDALKGSLKNTMVEVRPTVFFGVPRVWEKLQEGIIAAGRANSSTKRRIVAWAMNVGLRSNLHLMRGHPRVLCYTIAKSLVFDKVRSALGLDRCRLCVSGAAPLSKKTFEFFMSLDILLIEVYGMSESTGPHTIQLPWSYNIGSIGKEFTGATTLLFDVNKDLKGEGEICMNGRHVFMGYLNMPDKTKEAIDNEGWLHSGDIGRKDPYGYLFITGRIKELIITAGGENIPPVPIEDKVKEALPCVSNCMLIGDKRKFLSMLLTLKTDINSETGEPTERLATSAAIWCRSIGSSANTVQEVIDEDDTKVLQAIQKGIDFVNKKATSRAQCIQKWTILPKDFSIPGGELGPTLKLKRPDILRIYATTIDAFYEGED
jgi:long-chain-fatty-acid--CoA ligase ACSBG